MSKQSDQKSMMGYVAKAMPRTCMNCRHFAFDKVQTHPASSWQPSGYFEDKNLRCTIGLFAVKKMATCNQWGAK